jgi:hypothetical protein
VSDTPPPPPNNDVVAVDGTEETTEEEENGDDNDATGDVELGDGTDVEDPNWTTQPPRPTSVSASSGGSTAMAWYRRMSTKYGPFFEDSSDGMRTSTIDLSNLASLFCILVDMVLCGYDNYCPDGRGYDPYPGGPAEWHDMYDALEESQRALCSGSPKS